MSNPFGLISPHIVIQANLRLTRDGDTSKNESIFYYSYGTEKEIKSGQISS